MEQNKNKETELKDEYWAVNHDNKSNYYTDDDAFYRKKGICYIPEMEFTNNPRVNFVTKTEVETMGIGYTYEDLQQEVINYLEEQHIEATREEILVITDELYDTLGGEYPYEVVREMDVPSLLRAMRY